MNFNHLTKLSYAALRGDRRWGNSRSTTIWIIMKLILFFTLALTLQVSADALGQRISLSAKNQPLKQVLKELRKQSRYSFIYNDSDLAAVKRVSLQVQQKEILEVLPLLFEDLPLTYTVKDRMISIMPRSLELPKRAKKQDLFEAGIDQQHIRGRVTNEKGEPLVGASVYVLDAQGRRTIVQTKTDEEGNFELREVQEGAKLEVVYLGYASQKLAARSDMGSIGLKPFSAEMDEVEVVSTGYQKIPKERATGSFVQIDKELLNRSVSTNLLDRLEGVTSGLTFTRSSGSAGGVMPRNETTGISIRGRSTIDQDVSADPLIILDNFPFEGSLDQINPNDVENITILRDAAAASIWGARSGNGVIVISTKKGTYQEKTKVDFNATTSFGERPAIGYSRNFLPSSSYMAVEKQLFDQGYYDANLTNTAVFPVVSPYVDLLDKHRAGLISDDELKMMEAKFASIDTRYESAKYFERPAFKQQYYAGIRSGGTKSNSYFSLGYDDNLDNTIGSGLRRWTVNIAPQFKLLSNLSFAPTVIMSQTNQRYGYSYRSPYPYVSLVTEDGNPAVVPHGRRDYYLQEMEENGFKDWTLRPLIEKDYNDRHQMNLHTILRGNLAYTPLHWLSFNGLFQYERQNNDFEDLQDRDSYAVRNLVNQFTQVNGTVFSYPVPDADILDYRDEDLQAYNFRLNGTIDKNWGEQHQLNILLGAEMKSSETSIMNGRYYGYDQETGTVLGNLNFNQYYPVNPSGLGSLLIDDGMDNITMVTRRFVSYFFNGAYQFKNRYTISASARKDGANLYGINTNDKFVPLWSLGFLYDLSKEDFYSFRLLPDLKLRFSYGFNGNSYNQAAYLMASFNRNTVNGLRQATIQTPPNPSLRWERVRNINFSVQFASKNNRLSGNFEIYQKDGLDLIEQILLKPSTGFTSFKGNAASVRNRGLDLELRSQNITGKFNWSTVFLYSFVKDRVLSFSEEYPTSYLVSNSMSTSGQGRYGLFIKEGNSLYGVYSYRSAGLDPETGDPIGYLNGDPSQDYTGIIASNTMENVVYHGSSRPTNFGSLRNTFSYGPWSLSANILFKSNYFIRKKSTSINLTEVLSSNNHDYLLAFAPQANQATEIPSIVYLTDANRNTFYQNSEALVMPGDHLRLQDISLSYKLKLKNSALELYGYANNIGILWRKNKWGLDPEVNDYFGLYPMPRNYSLGARIQF